MIASMAEKSNQFTIHNLPYGIVSTTADRRKRCATALGDWAIDLSVLWETGLFNGICGLEKNVFDNVLSFFTDSSAPAHKSLPWDRNISTNLQHCRGTVEERCEHS